jgi:hypothetical protein
MVTEKPLDCRSLASEAAMIPFPREELTPPVTKMYFVLGMVIRFVQNYKVWGLMQEFSFFNLEQKKDRCHSTAIFPYTRISNRS